MSIHSLRRKLCIQALILLGIYSMFDPSETSLWHVVGFAARVAISLNLHRRVDDANLPPAVVEQRKRVFYSLYNLDRLVAATLSKPLAIADDDIDVQVWCTYFTILVHFTDNAYCLMLPPIYAIAAHSNSVRLTIPWRSPDLIHSAYNQASSLIWYHTHNRLFRIWIPKFASRARKSIDH